MWLINLTVNLFSIIKTRALECVSIINRKCMPRPKILDVNEGVGEALFYLYNVLVNKCSGSCDTLNNPMAKLCVPNMIKRVNMKVYNFLMRLNETRNVLWHKGCKCVCRLNSSVCNNKQIWNSDTCRCDCNEDFASIINCTKGYIWDPSTCETMINNKDNIDNNNTITNIFIGLFSVVILLYWFAFVYSLILSGLKIKNYLKINILTVPHTIIKMVIKSLKIKNQS